MGESFDAARALGIRPGMVQLQAVLLGGLLSGIGGAILSVDYTQTWANDISKGLGLVAVGLVIAARWNPWLVLPVALLFGGTDAAVLRLQAAGWRFPPISWPACPTCCAWVSWCSAICGRAPAAACPPNFAGCFAEPPPPASVNAMQRLPA